MPEASRLPPIAPPADMADALLRCVVDGLYVVDASGCLRFLNPAGEEMLGYDETQLRGRDVHEAIHHQDGQGQPQRRADCSLLGVLATGQAVRVESDWFTRSDGGMIEVAYSSSPIIEDGEVAGAVVIFHDITSRRAVERRERRLTVERERAGVEWQRNLMPAELAEVPGVDVAVSFRPVGRDALVGGDFYDIVPTGDGHLLVLGDVRGKGPGAAVIAAMVRYLLRGAADAGTPTQGLLDLVNAELLTHPSERFVTLALVHLRRQCGDALEATISCAGHPPVVVLSSDGAARTAGGRGPLLGVFEQAPVPPETVILDPGDTLVLYSDGLADVGRGATGVSADVPSLAAGLRGTSAEVVTALELAAGVVDVEDSPDDVAILVARSTPGALPRASAAPPASGTVPADAGEIGEVEAAVRDHNERLAAGRPAVEPTIAVTCECGREACVRLIEVPHTVYNAVRDDDRRFVLVSGHEIPRAESVVERHTDFVVVRKHGEAGDVAAAAAADDENTPAVPG